MRENLLVESVSSTLRTAAPDVQQKELLSVSG